MKYNFAMMALALGLAAPVLRAQVPMYVDAGEQNGALVWTNTSGATTLYRVPATTIAGQSMVTWQPAQGVQMPTSGAVRIPMPVRFAVVQVANRFPSGMVLIEAGEVVRGSMASQEEQPIHTNYINAFYMDRFEVPYAKWARIRDWGLTNGYTDLSMGTPGWVQSIGDASAESNHPVVYINWYEAIKWCNARSEAEGLSPAVYLATDPPQVFRTGEVDNPWVDTTANGYRLPTEAEWEKAARGGLEQNIFPWPSQGEGGLTNFYKDIYANFNDSHDIYEAGTTPVGWYNGSQWIWYFMFIRMPARDMANGYGLYDMAGNVSEWCWDWYDSLYYEQKVYDNPFGPASSIFGRVTRGGDWYNNAIWMRCAARGYEAAYQRRNYLGFRCVRRANVLE